MSLGAIHMDLSGSVEPGTHETSPTTVVVDAGSPMNLVSFRVSWPCPDVGLRLRLASGEVLFPTRGKIFAEAPGVVSCVLPIDYPVTQGTEIVVELTNSTDGEQFVQAILTGVGESTARESVKAVQL